MAPDSERTLAAQAGERAGGFVRLQGWTHRIRRVGAVNFILLRDRSGIIQVVVESTDPAAAVLAKLGTEDVVEVTGTVRAEPAAPGGYELRAASLRRIAPAAPLPFEINLPKLKVRQELALDHRVLSLRHPRGQAVFRIKAALIDAFRRFSRQQGFIEVQTPKIVATATEGGANLFPVDYLGRPAYLAQSPQFYKQMLVLAGFERVYEVGPVYRAEPHHTSRHVNEFTSLDWEVGFIETAAEVMDLEERMLRGLVETVSADCRHELDLLGVDLARALPAGPIPRLPLAEAKRLLADERGVAGPPGDLDPEGERLLCELLGGPVFVTDWPVASRPAYTQPWPDRPELTDSFDLLLGGVEVTTGGRRIADPAALRQSLVERGLEPERFEFYLEGFSYGAPPHGGLAIGAERLTAALLGLANLREATFFPRDVNRLTP